ncbi:hypothetical protein Q5H93_20645 [Hymenobacter sp. ASUV-10]|uniref:Uncharacterized protein n=1 Tax=Hymenobacter aranciens TaxID=3063996 RepID=A0ABT9BJI4_9BACT|nr:hypothetical protein [Hymenobacter sp. ASUV-10]MDO7877167.1 hypothetical protein [Hymenobacter sp. ASUV-10]
MKYLKALLLLTLGSCAGSQQMLEVTCESSAYSKKDGMLLATYHMEPASITDASGFSFAVKEAFVERRFMMNSKTGEAVWLANGDFLAKLVVIPTKESKPGTLAVTWDARLVSDSLPAAKTMNARESVAYRTGAEVYVFRLFSPNKFECREIKAVILVRQPDKSMKKYSVVFTADVCY